MSVAAQVFDDLNDKPLPVPEPFWVEVMSFLDEGEEVCWWGAFGAVF